MKIHLAGIVLLFVTVTALAEVGVPIHFGPHVITFDGVVYDPLTDRSTWSYTATSYGSPAISHWVLGLCVDHQVLTADPIPWEVTTDVTTGVYGIKWDDLEFGDAYVTKQFSVTLEGNWEIAEVEAAIKAGGEKYYGQIQGPSCTRLELEVTPDTLGLLITQPKLDSWFGYIDERFQPFGGSPFTVTVTGETGYTIVAYYTVFPTPSPSFSAPPLRIENPEGSGNWVYLSEDVSSPTTLQGIAGDPGSNTFPVEVDLSRLDDREAGESFIFTIHVVVFI